MHCIWARGHFKCLSCKYLHIHGYLVTSRLLSGHNLFIFNVATHPIDFGRVVKLLDCKTSRSRFLRNAER